ncbi:MAG: DUF4838 domain-containing protein [Puniceicoccaceae bacterium]
MRWLLFLLFGSLSGLSATLPEGYGSLLLGRNVTPEVELAAGHLADFLEKDFGIRPNIRRIPLAGRPSGIVIRTDPYNGQFDSDPLTDEILIERTEGRIQIVGSDNSSTCFAVYRFIEHCLGWRYFAPGDLGLEKLDDPPAPPASSGQIEVILYDKALFYSRNLQGLGATGHPINWRTWHGLRERFAFNHTLHRVLDPSLFDEHPDWFAKDPAGVPMKPPFDTPHGYNDHPDLSHPEVRAHVIRQTTSALKSSIKNSSQQVFPTVLKSPGIISTSISLGDSFVFGNYPDSYTWNPDGYIRRWPDWSNHVFDYSNSIAVSINQLWKETARHVSEDRRLYLGALSYLNWEDVPDFKVDSSIVPYLTYDRSQWYDPQARASDLELVSEWAANGPEFLGTWDYMFGQGFLIPRSMINIVRESIPSVYDRGVRAYFSQVGAQWPYDAHTNYLASRLLWNPNSDAERLMEEFFKEFFGPASEEMEAFFTSAEAVWMKQADAGWWLRYWRDPWQAALLKDSEIIQMQGLLDQASAKAKSSANQPSPGGLRPSRFEERIKETAQLFELTRSMIDYQRACWELQSINWETVSRKELESGLTLVRSCRNLRDKLISTAAQVSGSSPRMRRAGDLNWIFIYDSISASQQAIEWLLEDSNARPFGMLRASKLKDKRFSEADDSRIWHQQFMDSENQHLKIMPDGNGFLVKDTRRGHLYQMFRAKEGMDYLALLDLQTSQSPTGEVYLEMDFYDVDHQLLGKSPRSRIAPTHLYGESQRIRSFMRAPKGSIYGRIKVRFFELDPGSEVKLEWIEVLELDRRNP